MNGAAETKRMLSAGFTQEEVAAWQATESSKLRAAGFNDAEIGAHWGRPEPDMAPVRQLITTNLAAATEKEKASTSKEPRPAKTITDALEAGLQISVGGLIGRGKAPDVVLPSDAGLGMKIMSGAATFAGDAIPMAAGAILGGATGAPAGPLAAATAVGGAFALPAALRATLMDAYEKGEFENFGDFWGRTAGILLDTGKAWITGATTGAVGSKVSALAAPLPAAARTTATLSAEVGTMVTVGKALELEVPTAEDYIVGAVPILGIKAGAAAAKKMRNIYAKSGAKPDQVVADAQKYPSVAQDLVATNIGVPRIYAAPDAVPAAKAPVKPAVTPDAAQSAVLSRISVNEKQKSNYTLDDFYTQVKDDLFPLRRLTDALAEGKELPAAVDPYITARLTRGSFGRADQMLEYGTFDYVTYKTTGKSFKAIMEPFKNDMDGVRAYAVAARAVELNRRGIETGVPLAEAKAVVQNGGKYAEVFKELQEFQNAQVKYLRDSGVISKDAFAVMLEANKDYVPFFRVMEDAPTGGPGKGMQVRDPIKGIRGSERTIIDPIESIIKNTYVYTALAERNAVGVKLVELAESSGLGKDLVKKIPQPAKPIEVTKAEVGKIVEQYGIKPEQAEAFTVFRRETLTPKDDQIVVFRDGKREVYEVPREVAAAIKATDRESVPLLIKIVGAPARTLRAGAVLAPDFMLRNVMRDQLSAFVLSKNGYVPVIDMVRGAMSMAKKDADFQNWLKSGGANSTLVAMDREFIQTQLFKLGAYKDAGLFDRAWNVVKTPVDMLRVTSELLENATRLGEFKKAVKYTEGGKADLLKAGFASREVTLDFGRMGANMRAANQIIAFLNAGMEGFDRTVRAAKDDPLAFTAKAAGMITLPSVLLWYVNHDDPRYREIPQWQKDLFWIVMTDKHIYRIPKPFELGVMFGTVPERLLDSFFTDNPDALRDFDKTMAQMFGLSVIPTAAIPMIDQFSNRSMFTGNAIIPADKERLLGEYQYNDYTSELAKALGALFGRFPGMTEKSLDDSSNFAGGMARALTSPVLIENYIRGWTGGLGMYALQIADKGLREAGVLPDPAKPATSLADIPVVKAFVVRYPSATAASIQLFYDEYYEKKKIYDTWEKAAENGDMAAADRLRGIDPSLFVQLDGHRETLTDMNKIIHMVNKNPDMPPEEKRQVIDTIYFRMIEIAKSGREILSAVKNAPVESRP